MRIMRKFHPYMTHILFFLHSGAPHGEVQDVQAYAPKTTFITDHHWMCCQPPAPESNSKPLEVEALEDSEEPNQAHRADESWRQWKRQPTTQRLNSAAPCRAYGLSNVIQGQNHLGIIKSQEFAGPRMTNLGPSWTSDVQRLEPFNLWKCQGQVILRILSLFNFYTFRGLTVSHLPKGPTGSVWIAILILHSMQHPLDKIHRKYALPKRATKKGRIATTSTTFIGVLELLKR